MSDTGPGKRRRRDVETIPSATPRKRDETAPLKAGAKPDVQPPAAEPTRQPRPKRQPKAQAKPRPEPERQPEPVREAQPEPQPTADEAEAELAAAVEDGPTVDDTLARADTYWRAFRALAIAFPRQRIDEPLSKAWTRKQMLAHVAAWHDLTTERLIAYNKSGAIQPLAVDIDSFNARVSRAAVGRTSGEVMGSLDASYSRLRRTISQLTDEQLRAHDAWAVQVIAGNTYDHYDEHAPDVTSRDLSSRT